MERRYLRERVEADIAGKPAFIAGPRQVGKTTLGLSLPGARSGYLNWDIPEHRGRILRRELPPGAFWFFDEIHKYRAWRNFLKGLYDGRPAGQRILPAGSARKPTIGTPCCPGPRKGELKIESLPATENSCAWAAHCKPLPSANRRKEGRRRGA